MSLDDRPGDVDGKDAPSGVDPHLDPEVMAAYADGVLAPGERNRVYRHITSCDRCRDVLSDLMSCLAEAKEAATPPALPFRRWRSVTIVAGGLAAAAALVLAIQFAQRAPERLDAPEPNAQVATLVAAYTNEPTRAGEGRLSAPFRYAPPPAVTRGTPAAERSPDVRIAAARIESTTQHDDTPAALHALGIAKLALGDADGAVMALEAASAADLSDGTIGADLAAAYLERARLRGSRDDRERALAVSIRALDLVPAAPAALFNKALALQELGRSSEAAAAWRAYLDVERDPQWTAEATRRLSEQ